MSVAEMNGNKNKSDAFFEWLAMYDSIKSEYSSPVVEISDWWDEMGMI